MILRPGVTLDDGWTLADSSTNAPSRGRADRSRTARDAELARRAVDARAGGGLVQVQVDLPPYVGQALAQEVVQAHQSP